MASPNIVETDQDQEREEGFFGDGEALSLELSEEEILSIIGRRVEDGASFWNKKLNLDKVRRDNEKRWKNKNLEVTGDELYGFQVPYKDNRLFVSVETLSSNVISALPDPVTIEAQDTDASRELATNYGKVLRRRLEKIDYKDKLQMVARHLLMGYRVAVQKYYWDTEDGRLKDDGSFTGEAQIKTLRPHKVVIDAEADDPDDIPLIAEHMRTTVEELILKYPKKKQEIMKAAGVKAGDKPSLGKSADYLEVWFSYYGNDGNKKEGVAWKIKDTLLDAGLNPNHNYNGTNYMEKPAKPYVVYNFIKTGRWIIDETSLLEQAASQQDIVEKRGRQIVENADRANSTVVFNTAMVNDADAEDYVGAPGQNILATGDVNQAFKRDPPPLLPRYVIEDKYDARREIDNIFGTHAPLRGEKTESPTLGQEVLSQRSDLGRVQALNDSIHRGALKVYNGITQLYKVYGKEEHIVKHIGEEGRTSFIAFSGDKIEDGLEIYIQPGSSMPDDKTVDRTNIIELAKLGGGIDPLTLHEKMHSPKARELAKRSIMYQWLPDQYMKEVLGMGGDEDGQEQAARDAKAINQGQEVEPPQNVSAGYVNWYKGFIQSPEFKKLPEEIQQAHIEHLRNTLAAAKQGLGEKGEGGGQQQQQQPPTGGVPAEGGDKGQNILQRSASRVRQAVLGQQ